MNINSPRDIVLIEEDNKRFQYAQAYRLNIMQEAANNKDLQEEIIKVCKNDTIAWIDDWAWTYNPKGEGEEEGDLPPDRPFILYPYQEEYINWLNTRYEENSDGLVEKSRTMGLTWIMAAYFTHHWLFEQGFTGSIGSYEAENVDVLGDLDSFLQKCRFILKNIPDFMLPEEFEVRGQYDNEKRIINPENDSRILGRVGDNMGRGGRSSIFFIDEHAHIENPDLVERSVSQNANVVIYGSTPHGRGNKFAEKRHSMNDKKIFTMHWEDHPHYDREWYEQQKKEYGSDPVLVAQELDIDYSASVEDICIRGTWSKKAAEYEVDNVSGERVAGLDVAGEGKNKNVYIERLGRSVERIESWTDGGPTEAASKAKHLAYENNVDRLQYDDQGVGQGVKGDLKGVDFEVVGIGAGNSPTSRRYPDTGERPADEVFADMRTEMWWKLRLHIKWTHDYAFKENSTERKEWWVDIPQHSDMLAELSYPKIEQTSSGKRKLESKRKMRSRGLESPDFADALALCFAYPDSGGSGGLIW